MFGDYYKAQLRKSGQGIKVDKKHGDKKVMTIGLQYNFDEALAHAIGPRAEAIQQMLASNDDAAIRMSGTALTLDTEHCTVKIKHRVKKSAVIHEIEKTNGIGMKASAPTANETEPTLEMSLQLPMEKKHMMFVEKYLNESLYLRLEKQQQELPLNEASSEE
jgi:hypothetical protein